MLQDLPTPCILIDAAIVRRNIERLSSYARSHHLGLRPHTKTHKSIRLAKMQLDSGAIGLTVAKVGEAGVMMEVADDILMAYPAVDAGRCAQLARLARGRTIRVGIDSKYATDAIAAAARSEGTTIGILIELDVGYRRTGVQSAADALALGEHVSRASGLRLDGIMFFPGHLSHGPPSVNEPGLRVIDEKLDESVDLWRRHGLEAKIVSGGSTPTAMQSHLIRCMTEIRPGTYIFNDMNCVRGSCAALEDCAARVLATVVSTAVPGQVVLDAGSKTLTSDPCGPAPESGHGYLVEYPQATITKLSEEHAQVDITACDRAAKVGERVTIIPNHICPCINLHDQVWWREPGEVPRPLWIDARGKVW